jgi:nucleotide-binding universal stress UspA family protein
MATLQSILVPMDGSPPSIAALDHAVALSQDFGATIDVLHVVPLEDPLGADARAEVERDMDTAVARARAELGRRLERRTVVGDPLREIVEAAREVDLIVIGTHGRIGRLYSMLGSIAEGVVRNAPCPVMTVRDPSGGYQSFAERRHRRPSLAEQTQPAHAHARDR